MLYVALVLFPVSALRGMGRHLERICPDPDCGADCEAWRRDPLSHPAIRAMSQREIADLPFDPRRLTKD